MNRVLAFVKPELLIWARKNVNLSIDYVAKKLKKNVDDITNWESGISHPTVSQLYKLANIYKRSTAFFYLKSPPLDDDILPEFRSIQNQEDNPITKDTKLAIRRAKRMQYIFQELNNNVDYPIKFKKISKLDYHDIEQSAINFRLSLNIVPNIQNNWKSEKKALHEWKKIIENNGIMVIEESFPITEGRGFAIYDKKTPIICVNSKDCYYGRIFSLFHEVGHILQEKTGISDFDDSITTEKYCNQFAAAVLVPIEELKEQFKRHIQNKNYNDDANIIKLSRFFKVSKQVILRRLLTFNYISKDFYTKKLNEWRNDNPRQGFSVNGRKLHEECVQKNSSIFINLAFENFRRNNITIMDISDYLHISPKYIRKVEKYYFQGE